MAMLPYRASLPAIQTALSFHKSPAHAARHRHPVRLTKPAAPTSAAGFVRRARTPLDAPVNEQFNNGRYNTPYNNQGLIGEVLYVSA